MARRLSSLAIVLFSILLVPPSGAESKSVSLDSFELDDLIIENSSIMLAPSFSVDAQEVYNVYNPMDASIGDINGDGRDDIVIVNEHDHGFTPYLQGTEGTYTMGSVCYTGRYPTQVAVGNFDGNARAEIVTVNSGDWNVPANITVHSYPANGTAATKLYDSVIPMEYEFTDVAIADINGDNQAEILLAYPSNITIYSKGTGMTLVSTTIDAGPGTHYLTTGDVDGDGKTDVVVSNEDGNSIGIFYQRSGTLAHQEIIAAGISPTKVAIFDADGDKKNDLVFGCTDDDTVKVLLNKNNFTATTIAHPSPSCVEGVDIDGDGVKEIVIASARSSMLGALKLTVNETGHITYTDRELACYGIEHDSLFAGKIISDSKEKIISVSRSSGSITALKLTPPTNRTLASQADYILSSDAGAVACGELSGDGLVDVVAAMPNIDAFALFIQSPSNNGKYNPPILIKTGRNPRAIAVADIDGDGKNETLVGCSNELCIYRQNAQGTLSYYSNVSVKGPVSIAVGDVSGDANVEVVIANDDNVNSQTDNITVLSRSGASWTSRLVETGSNPRDVAIGDVNSDGKNEIAVICADSHRLDIFTNGGASASDLKSYQASHGSQCVRIGDVNNDGKNDVVIASPHYRTVGVYVQNADRTLNDEATYSTGAAGSYRLGIGDMNGDGRNDVVVALAQNQDNYNPIGIAAVGVLTQSNGGVLNPIVIYPSNGMPSDLCIADVDCDGRLDVVSTFNAGWHGGIGVNAQLHRLGYATIKLQKTRDVISSVLVHWLGDETNGKIRVFAKTNGGEWHELAKDEKYSFKENGKELQIKLELLSVTYSSPTLTSFDYSYTTRSEMPNEYYVGAMGLIIVIPALLLAYFVLRKPPVHVEDLFLINNDGRLITHYSRGLRADVDSEVLSGMMTAVHDFTSTVLSGGNKDTGSLEYSGKRIYIMRGKHMTLAASCIGKESERFKKMLGGALEAMEAKGGKDLKDWSGEKKVIDAARDALEKLFKKIRND